YAAVDPLDGASNDVQTDAAAGDLRRLVAGGEPWLEEGLREVFRTIGRFEPSFAEVSSDRGKIEPATIVVHRDAKPIALGDSADRNGSSRRLPETYPLPRGLDAVVDGVADQV